MCVCVCVLLACMHTCISAHVAVGGQLARIGFFLLPYGSCQQGPSLPESSCQPSLTIFLSNLVSIFILAMLLKIVGCFDILEAICILNFDAVFRNTYKSCFSGALALFKKIDFTLKVSE